MEYKKNLVIFGVITSLYGCPETKQGYEQPNIVYVQQREETHENFKEPNRELNIKFTKGSIEQKTKDLFDELEKCERNHGSCKIKM